MEGEFDVLDSDFNIVSFAYLLPLAFRQGAIKNGLFGVLLKCS